MENAKEKYYELWKYFETTEENCEMLKLWKKSKLNNEKIWKTQKTIVKWYGKYGRNVKWYGKYGKKVSWIVKRFGKYRRKLWNDMENKDEMWNDMENMEERQVEKWKDMENMEEK
jgi:hypothetical protein